MSKFRKLSYKGNEALYAQMSKKVNLPNIHIFYISEKIGERYAPYWYFVTNRAYDIVHNEEIPNVIEALDIYSGFSIEKLQKELNKFWKPCTNDAKFFAELYKRCGRDIDAILNGDRFLFLDSVAVECIKKEIFAPQLTDLEGFRFWLMSEYTRQNQVKTAKAEARDKAHFEAIENGLWKNARHIKVKSK